MEIVAQKEELLGTSIEIKLAKQHSHLFSLCFDEIKRIEAAYSRFIDNSELSKLNKRLGEWTFVSDEFYMLIRRGEEFRRKTDGNFDITVKAILDDLGYDQQYSFRSKGQIKTWIRNENDIEFEEKQRRVLIRKEIDFGGIGKGFALDRIARILESKGVFHYYINGGGDIYAKKGEELEAWPVLLEHPDDAQRAIGKIELDGRSIAASSANRRRWGNAHHLINMKIGKPATGVKAIFVLAKTGMEADVYAKAVFTAGFEEGIELSNKLPIETLIISSNNKMYKSKGFEVEFFD
ncbi:FAD:protein FMN transferase [Candidatus Micrarchaeota archaeon]|nr:FAD:protein FMN transferase [Candidatus Micrarchaeota archaeon]